MRLLSRFSKRGQASFEMMFVLSVVVILATVVLLNGISNFYELTALGFIHNGYNLFKVQEDYSGPLKGIVLEGSDILDAKLRVTEDVDFNKYSSSISGQIKDKSKYTDVIISMES